MVPFVNYFRNLTKCGHIEVLLGTAKLWLHTVIRDPARGLVNYPRILYFEMDGLAGPVLL
jgi:hypothetical protein